MRESEGGGQSGMQGSSARVKFIAAWALLLALKLLFAVAMPLFGDEAFYAWEALHPAWAYSDLPGGTAALVGLGTFLLGDSQAGVRVAFVALGAALPWLVVRLARRVAARWPDLRTSPEAEDDRPWLAGLWSLPIPLLMPLGVMALPDALLTFATLLALDACTGMLDDRDAKVAPGPARPARTPGGLDAQFGLALALGALAHYRFAPLILLGGLAFLLAGGSRRLRWPGLWMALAAGALAWLPLVHFNLGVDAAGLRFQIMERHPWDFHAAGLGQPLLQAIITTPLLYALFLWALWFALRRRPTGACPGETTSPVRFLACAGLGVWLFYALLAPFVDRARFSLHWPLPAYLAAAALLPFALRDVRSAWPRRLAPWAAGLAAVATLAMAAAFTLPASPAIAARSAGTSLYPDNFVGWREIGRALQPRLGPGDVVVADHFMLAAQLSFQLDRRAEVFVLDHWNNHKHGRAAQLALWGYDEAGMDRIAPGRRAWIAFEVGETPAAERAQWVGRVCRWFADVRFVETVEGPGGGKRFWLFEGRRAAPRAEGSAPGACSASPPGGTDRPQG